VTDAHLALGHLLPTRPLGGLATLDLEASRRAIENRVAEPLGMSCEAAALGILEVADAAMERAIRVVSVERGCDPRGYALLAFGGAGPLHGISIARRLAIPRVIVPWAAGVLSAFGLLVAETGHDLSQSLLRPLSSLDAAVVGDVLVNLKAQGVAMLRAEGFDAQEMRFQASADLRYLGQSHELNVAIDEGASGGVDLARTREAFDRVHRERYGHASPDEAVELVTVRLRASGPPVKAETRRALSPEVSRGSVGTWRVWFDPSGPVVTRVVERGSIAPGEWFDGPMVILGDDATVLVPPSAGGRANERGDLVFEVG
jgi:N-methylhydantoinase A